MNILIINGTNYKKNTYYIAKQLVNKISNETTKVDEISLPRDLPSLCAGCGACFKENIDLCPHRTFTKPLEEKMDNADILIFVVPTYVYHAPSSLMNFLDHFCSLWLLHKPLPSMFLKQAVVISTSAGKGQKEAIKDVTDSLEYWGVPRIYTLGVSLKAARIEKANPKILKSIYASTTKIAKKLKKRYNKVTPSFKARFKFFIIRKLIKHIDMNESDTRYWKKQGWYYNEKPWHKKTLMDNCPNFHSGKY